MNYYEVWISSQRYHSDKPLTYSHESRLKNGQIVTVPMQHQIVVGVVYQRVGKPSFATKDILQVIGGTPVPSQILELIDWLKSYYPGPFGQVVSLALPAILTSKSQRKPDDPIIKPIKVSQPTLNKSQTQVVSQIHEAYPKSVLVHGDTGTGKTRIYVELARENIAKGRSVIVLTPEIGLTPQLAVSFQEEFPGQTVVIHSELSSASRRNIWLRILESTSPLVVIGPRSALFTPLKNVGLIVIDEFHEPSYKQEQAPHYLASRVGAKLAELHGGQLILGSATPLVSDYYTFDKKGLPIIRLQEQAIKHDHDAASTIVVDLKDKEAFTHSPWLSDVLIEAIKESRKNNQQSLVFLNRRGTARLVLCQVCGWQALCPICDLPLTYHADKHTMQCHTCGHVESTPSSCPECGANDIVFRSAGTKSIVTEIERLIPGAVVKRFDSDTLKPDRLEQQYTSVKAGSADVLVGTQMLGKGLDLPKLSVVGIITAETSLSFPDYTAEERTYQLITQALGRVNRGHVPGTAIVQAHNPDSVVIQAATKKDYKTFYDQQITERRLYKFPPFRFTLKLTCSRANNAAAKKASEQLAEKLRSNHSAEVIGPNPAFSEKAHGQYHWQIVIKSARRQRLVDIVRDLPSNWAYDIDPINLL